MLAERRGDARVLYCNQQVKLDGHLLIVVRLGFLRVTIDGVQLKIEAGHAILLSELNFEISELVGPGQGIAAFSWFLFDDALLSKLSSPKSDVEGWQSYANYPCAQSLVGFDAVRVRAIESLPHDAPETFLLRLLRARFNEFHPPMIKLLVNRIMLPRLKIRLFVENLVFLRKEQIRAFRARYPEGSKALGRELSRLGLPSLLRLVAQRRRELRRVARARGLLVPPVARPKKKISPPTNSWHVTPSAERAKDSVRAPVSGESDFLYGDVDDDRGISSALPTDVEEVKVLQLVQQEEISEVLSSKIIQFPGMEVYAEMLMAA